MKRTGLPKTVMLGPCPSARGGISRVVKTWQDMGILNDLGIVYLPTALDSMPQKFWRPIRSIFSLLWLCISGCDVIYIHTSAGRSFYRKCCYILVGCLFRKKIFLHVHPSRFASFVASSRRLRGAIMRLILTRIHGFVVLTREMQIKTRELFPKKPVYVLPNIVDRKLTINRSGVARESNRLLYLGWFIEKKGVYDLVEAVYLLRTKGYHVFLDYYGDKEHRRLRELVAERGLNDVISVNGWVDDRAKCEILHRATMLILPSYTEGMPNVILEAMATHTPIVSTRVGGLKELLIDEDNALIFEPGDIAGLSRQIERYLNDPELRAAIAARAYRHIAQQHDPSSLREELARIISSMDDYPVDTRSARSLEDSCGSLPSGPR